MKKSTIFMLSLGILAFTCFCVALFLMMENRINSLSENSDKKSSASSSPILRATSPKPDNASPSKELRQLASDIVNEMESVKKSVFAKIDSERCLPCENQKKAIVQKKQVKIPTVQKLSQTKPTVQKVIKSPPPPLPRIVESSKETTVTTPPKELENQQITLTEYQKNLDSLMATLSKPVVRREEVKKETTVTTTPENNSPKLQKKSFKKRKTSWRPWDN